MTLTSHARTVVRECCKGDDESQWEMGKFDPRHPKTPKPMVTKICVRNYVGDIYHYCKKLNSLKHLVRTTGWITQLKQQI